MTESKFVTDPKIEKETVEGNYPFPKKVASAGMLPSRVLVP